MSNAQPLQEEQVSTIIIHFYTKSRIKGLLRISPLTLHNVFLEENFFTC